MLVVNADLPELDTFAVVLLRRGARADVFSDAELDELQNGHIAHMNKLRDEGTLVTNGPFLDQRDETLRGFCIYSCSLEEARRLAEQDPSVRAGRLTVESFTWLVPAGTMGPR